MRIVYSIIEAFLRYIGGGLGRKVRFWYYKFRLGSCGSNVIIDEGVFFENPEDILLGSNIWIDKNCIFIAGKLSITSNYFRDAGTLDEVEEGKLIVGNSVHIGINTLIQAHGGVKIGNYFTSSPGCKLYSVSNDVKKCKAGTFGEGPIHYVKSPILIEDNVWLGINATVLGGTIKKNSFISSCSNVFEDIAENSIASGNPAVKVKNRFDF